MPALIDTSLRRRGVFDDQRVFYRGSHTLSGRAFQAYVDAFLATIEAVHGLVPRLTGEECANTFSMRRARDARGVALDSVRTSMRFYTRVLLPCESLPVYRGRFQTGEVSFTTPVSIPTLGDNIYTWMSLTPSEISSQVPGVRRARGNVLIGGLGLGWFARKVLEQPGVTRVTVVDSRQPILDYFGKPLARDFGDRVRFVCGDAFKCVRPSAYDTVLYDIWPGCGQSANDARWLKIASRHPNAWAW